MRRVALRNLGYEPPADRCLDSRTEPDQNASSPRQGLYASGSLAVFIGAQGMLNRFTRPIVPVFAVAVLLPLSALTAARTGFPS